MPSLLDLSGPVLEQAPRLLDAVLRHGDVAVRITEVEAYDGANDPGSHAYRGRTNRNAVMFGPSGHLYCYFTYGMHVCCNVVCGPEGDPSAVLLRAGEVVDGIEIARERRPGAPDRDLARGPARLCQALDIDRSLDGADVCVPESSLRMRWPDASTTARSAEIDARAPGSAARGRSASARIRSTAPGSANWAAPRPSTK